MPPKNEATLKIQFPFEDPIKTPAERMERFEIFFYTMFHLLVRNNKKITCEIAAANGVINFYMTTLRRLIPPVLSSLYSSFPNVDVAIVESYDNIRSNEKYEEGFLVDLIGSDSFTLRTKGHGASDPLNSLFSFLSSLPARDAAVFQMVLLPMDESFGGQGGGIYGYSEKKEVAETKLKFQATMRIAAFTEKSETLDSVSAAVEHVFAPLSSEQNYLRVRRLADEERSEYFAHFWERSLIDGYTYTATEIAALFHAPDPDAKIAGMNWVYARKAEPPMSLPTPIIHARDDLSMFGDANFRGSSQEFGILREDRRRHLYIVGKSGSGKSKLIEKLLIDDMNTGQGVCLIDPHGDLVQNVLRHVPEHRIKDVVYMNPADLQFPIAFNPLDNVAREYKQQVTNSMISIFKKFFGADWSPKIEHVFRYTVLALLDYEHATIMGMQKMLTERTYRQKVVAQIKDHVIRKFWTNEFSGWSEKFDNEAIIPLVNKLGQFLSNELVRNIVAQPKNKVNLDDIMNNQRILLVELSKGMLGEENAALLGSLIITKIEQQGMARAAIPEEQRKDFYLYVDEFQNFATSSFDDLLAEARKYRLNLTLSHQFLGQLSERTKQTVFGNVGSLITFRMSADDGKYIAQEYAPRFGVNDIMNLSVRDMYIKMTIGGQVTPAFSARTLSVPAVKKGEDYFDQCVAMSRKNYATPLATVEAEIAALYDENVAAVAGTNGAAAVAAPEEDPFDAPLI